MTPDTIAAIATAAGRGAVGLVRVSGPDALGVLRAVAPEFAGGGPPARRASLARIVDPVDGSPLDRALVVRYAGPASYTGEDLVEISCHGGWLVPTLVLEACRSAGARVAEPGEFTRRAYLNGKLDLVQVEAVADLVEARSRALHRASMTQLDRGLSARIAGVREGLVRVEAYLAHHLDFPEEDDAPVPVERIVAEVDGVVEEVDRLLATAPEGALLREGAVTVLAGRPNVGKSSLYNALVGEERALVTDVPGTTRDALEASVELGGYPFRLVDTAGLRDTDDRVEGLGIEVARRALARADVVLLCVEGGAGEDDGLASAFLERAPGVPVVVVHTKADRAGPGLPGPDAWELRGDGRAEDGAGGAPGPVAGEVVGEVDGKVAAGVSAGGGRSARGPAAVVSVSAHTGQGLDTLRRVLPQLVFSGLVDSVTEAPVVTRRRQAEALRTARKELVAFRAALAEGVPAEMAGTHLRPAETALEEILGVISVDDVLDVLFSSFCVGK